MEIGTRPEPDRARIGRLVAGGLVMGIVATATYDVVKLVLAAFDPSPFNPFEAIRHFGASLVGEGAAGLPPMAMSTRSGVLGSRMWLSPYHK